MLVYACQIWSQLSIELPIAAMELEGNISLCLMHPGLAVPKCLTGTEGTSVSGVLARRKTSLSNHSKSFPSSSIHPRLTFVNTGFSPEVWISPNAVISSHLHWA